MHLEAVPFQIIHLTSGIILKRGCTELSVDGENAALVLQLVLDRLAANPATAEELAEIFAPSDRPAILDLVQYLVDRRLLMDAGEPDRGPPDGEAASEVFFWHFGLTPTRAAEAVSRRSVAVVGVNRVASSVVSTLIEAGIGNVRVIDYAPLRNSQLLDGDGAGRWPSHLPSPSEFNPDEAASAFSGVGCLVATSDFGGWRYLEHWNRPCVERDLHFLPIVLDNLIGWAGPLVIPGRTACLACLRGRMDSNDPQPALRHLIDGAAQERKSIAGAHPAMAEMLGTVGAMELIKFYNRIPGWQTGQTVEVNLLTSRMTPRRVLKLPRCPVCSAFARRSSVDVNIRAPVSAPVEEPA